MIDLISFMFQYFKNWNTSEDASPVESLSKPQYFSQIQQFYLQSRIYIIYAHFPHVAPFCCKNLKEV